MSEEALVDVPAIGLDGELIPYKQAIFKGGAPPFDGHPGRRLHTPHGDVGISRPQRGLVQVSGPGIGTFSLRTSEPLSVVEARRGLDGSAGDVPIRIWRPKFGFRFRDRDGRLSCGEIELRAVNVNRSCFTIHDHRTGSVLFKKNKYHLSTAHDITAPQLGLSIIMWRSWIMDYSTLLSFITI